jgi:hypothetical protein
MAAARIADATDFIVGIMVSPWFWLILFSSLEKP